MQKVVFFLLILISFVVLVSTGENVPVVSGNDEIVTQKADSQSFGKSEVVDLHDLSIEKLLYLNEKFEDFEKLLRNLAAKNGISVTKSIHNTNQKGQLAATWILGDINSLSIHTFPEAFYAVISTFYLAEHEQKIAPFLQNLSDFLQPGKSYKLYMLTGDKSKGIMHGFPYRADICLNGESVATIDWNIFKNVTILEKKTSKYQEMVVFDSPKLGRCLALDDTVQFCTGEDETYTREFVQRPLNFLKLFGRHNMKTLIVGGGDGWVASHLLEHYQKEIAEINLVDLDEAVTKITLKHFSHFFNPNFLFNKSDKVKIHYQDASVYLRSSAIPLESLDFVILDCTDPTKEPSKVLYTEEFFRNIFNRMKKGSVLVQQMDTQDEDYEPFLHQTRLDWEKIGFRDVMRWQVPLASFSGNSVYFMAIKY